MKSLLKSLVLVSSLVSLNSLAEADMLGNRGCVLKLSKEQHTAVIKLHKEAALAAKELRVELVKARKELKKSLLEQNITKEEVKAMSLAVTEKQQSLTAIKKAAKLDIMFDVLSPEQRIKMAKCEQLKKRSRIRMGGRHPRVERRQVRPHVRRHHHPHQRRHGRRHGGGPRPLV